MGKDADTYRYFHIGILWNSETLEDIKQDSIESHMQEQPNKMLAERIAEYYRLKRRGFIIPGVTAAAVSMMPTSTPTRSNGYYPGGNGAHDSQDDQPEEQQLSSEDPDQGDNVDASADYWTTL